MNCSTESRKRVVTLRTLTRIGLGSLALLLLVGTFAFQPVVGTLPPVAHWFPQYDFDPVTFANPPVGFRPYARWWWPGNDVTKTELQREINLFGRPRIRGR